MAMPVRNKPIDDGEKEEEVSEIGVYLDPGGPPPPGGMAQVIRPIPFKSSASVDLEKMVEQVGESVPVSMIWESMRVKNIKDDVERGLVEEIRRIALERFPLSEYVEMETDDVYQTQPAKAASPQADDDRQRLDAWFARFTIVGYTLLVTAVKGTIKFYDELGEKKLFPDWIGPCRIDRMNGFKYKGDGLCSWVGYTYDENPQAWVETRTKCEKRRRTREKSRKKSHKVNDSGTENLSKIPDYLGDTYEPAKPRTLGPDWLPSGCTRVVRSIFDDESEFRHQLILGEMIPTSERESRLKRQYEGVASDLRDMLKYTQFKDPADAHSTTTELGDKSGATHIRPLISESSSNDDLPWSYDKDETPVVETRVIAEVTYSPHVASTPALPRSELEKAQAWRDSRRASKDEVVVDLTTADSVVIETVADGNGTFVPTKATSTERGVDIFAPLVYGKPGGNKLSLPSHQWVSMQELRAANAIVDANDIAKSFNDISKMVYTDQAGETYQFQLNNPEGLQLINRLHANAKGHYDYLSRLRMESSLQLGEIDKFWLEENINVEGVTQDLDDLSQDEQLIEVDQYGTWIDPDEALKDLELLSEHRLALKVERVTEDPGYEVPWTDEDVEREEHRRSYVKPLPTAQTLRRRAVLGTDLDWLAKVTRIAGEKALALRVKILTRKYIQAERLAASRRYLNNIVIPCRLIGELPALRRIGKQRLTFYRVNQRLARSRYQLRREFVEVRKYLTKVTSKTVTDISDLLENLSAGNKSEPSDEKANIAPSVESAPPTNKNDVTKQQVVVPTVRNVVDVDDGDVDDSLIVLPDGQAIIDEPSVVWRPSQMAVPTVEELANVAIVEKFLIGAGCSFEYIQSFRLKIWNQRRIGEVAKSHRSNRQVA